MIIETFAANRVRTFCVRPVVKESKLRQGPFYRFGARQVTALNGDRINSQSKTRDCNRGWRSFARALRHQARRRMHFMQEKLKRIRFQFRQADVTQRWVNYFHFFSAIESANSNSTEATLCGSKLISNEMLESLYLNGCCLRTNSDAAIRRPISSSGR